MVLGTLTCQTLAPPGRDFAVPSATAPASVTPASGNASTVVATVLTVPVNSTESASGPSATAQAGTPTPQTGAAGAYVVQPGDTLSALALRFRTDASTIQQLNPGLDPVRFLPPGLALDLPWPGLSPTAFSTRLLPDRAVIFSPAARAFDVRAFVLAQPGYLAAYSEVLTVGAAPKAGWEIVADYALRYSIDPRLLLALLEQQSGALSNPAPEPYVMAHGLLADSPAMEPGLSHQLGWAGNQLTYGYYGWRAGTVLNFSLADGAFRTTAPTLNAGSFALVRLLGLLYRSVSFPAVAGPDGLAATYRRLFGDPSGLESPPVIPGGLAQPVLQLPFEPGKAWAFTGGPHSTYGRTLPWGALDFAPPAELPGCVPSPEWVVAVHDGTVVYSYDGLVLLDIGGGWVVSYLHVETADRALLGAVVEAGQRLGHPGCEGGRATADHLHIARAYNGELLAADGPVPFELSGWVAHAGATSYRGTLVHAGDGRVVEACSCAKAETRLWIEP